MNIFEDGTITLKLIGEAGKGFATEAETPTDAELAGILRQIIERLEDVGADDSGADDVNTIPVVWANVSFGAAAYTHPAPVPALTQQQRSALVGDWLDGSIQAFRDAAKD